MIADAHTGWGALFVAFGLGAALGFLIIEPTTARAALDKHRSRDQDPGLFSSSMIWDREAELVKSPPAWSLTGQLCLWADGSPAHVQQEPFRLMGAGWEAYALVSRSTQTGSRWLAITLRLEPEVRVQWEQTLTDRADHIYVQLSNYLLLREWYGDDLGVLYLK